MASSSIVLRGYQARAIDCIFDWFNQGLGNPLIEAPTASGKSVVMGEFIRRCVTGWPGTKIMLLAHVKELLEQNYKAMKSLFPEMDIGLYSAGLGCRHRHNSVIVGGIQSVHGKHDLFGYVDLLVVDECHLLNAKNTGRYRQFIEGLKQTNPKLKIVGFTATPYRLDHGYIDRGEEAIFDGTAYQISVERLIEDGYLCMPVPRNGSVQADLSNVHLRGGEYIASEMAEAFDHVDITLAVIKDVQKHAADRKGILVFCASLHHAQQVMLAFKEAGEHNVDMVNGKTSPKARAELVRRIRSGELRILINCNVFTTGFDAPNIDCIVLLRATQSTGLYVQMVGRGMRICKGKSDCLVLDYGTNVQRHGPLNNLAIKESKKNGKSKERKKFETPVKECPNCGCLIAAKKRFCIHCKHVFRLEKINNKAAMEHIIVPRKMDRGQEKWFDVDCVRYRPHQRYGKIPSMRVDYYFGINDWASEWVCFQHDGYPQQKAIHWARRRGVYQTLTVIEAIRINWPKPLRVLVRKNENGFLNVIDAELEDA